MHTALKTALRQTPLYPNSHVNRLLRTLSPQLFLRLQGPPPTWAVGVLHGATPMGLRPTPESENPILRGDDITDVPALLVADPFAVHVDGRWHLYFEVFNVETAKGEIGLATSSDLLDWTYRGIVLREPFHLSYPMVFEWDAALYMVPESWEAGAARLYRAFDPEGPWDLVTDLLRGPTFLDTTVLRHDGRWYLFTETSPNNRYDTLRLFTSAYLRGPWEQHPMSPIVAGDAGRARPGGRVIVHDGTPIRMAQDCGRAYGAGVRAFAVSDLSPDTFAERQLDLRIDSGTWRTGAMHHLDLHASPSGGWIAFVDGHP